MALIVLVWVLILPAAVVLLLLVWQAFASRNVSGSHVQGHAPSPRRTVWIGRGRRDRSSCRRAAKRQRVAHRTARR